MRVRMLQPIGGTVDGVRYPKVGGEFDVADAAGAKLCEKGQAEPVADVKPERSEPKKRETRRA
jgi:hypothetical protein